MIIPTVPWWNFRELSEFQNEIFFNHQSSCSSVRTIRFASGSQYNKWFGTELYTASAPSLKPDAIVADLRANADQRLSPRDINTRQNSYLGLLSKIFVDIHTQFSPVGKVGVAKYSTHRISAEIFGEDEDDRIRVQNRNVKGGVEGYSPVLAFGFEVPFPDQNG